MRFVTPPCAYALVFGIVSLSIGACAQTLPDSSTTPNVAPIGDLDADGVADAHDRCARDAEDMDGYLDDDGCPDPEDGCDERSRTAMASGLDTITASIAFEPGTTNVLPESYPVLSQLGTSLRLATYVEHIVVVGLADAEEPDPETLSRTRATRVRDFLVAHGVDAARLEVFGAGLSDPLPTVAPFPSEHPRQTVWFVVERADGETRHVRRGGVFVATEVVPGARSGRRTSPPGCP